MGLPRLFRCFSVLKKMMCSASVKRQALAQSTHLPPSMAMGHVGPGPSFAIFLGGSDFRSKFFEIWAARRARTKGAYFRETCVFRFAWRIHGSRCCTPRRSVVQRRYDAYNRLQGVSRCLNARPGAPRDSAPAAVYVVFGPALKKLWKLVMGRGLAFQTRNEV